MTNWFDDVDGYQPIELVGPMRGTEVPATLYGIFNTLMVRSTVLGEDICVALGSLGLTLPERPYYVILLSLADHKLVELHGRQRFNCAINLYQALRQHMIEQLGDRFTGCLYHYTGYLMGVVFPLDDSSPEDVLREAVEYARTELGYGCHGVISGPWDDVLKLETAYHIVVDVESSRAFYHDLVARVYLVGPESILRMMDSDQRTAFEQAFFSVAERVCGMVRAGEPDSAAAELRQQLRRIAENCVGMPFPAALNNTVNRFISVLQFRLAQEDLADWRYLSDMDFSRQLISSVDLEEFEKTGDRMAQALVEHAKQRMEHRHDSLMHDIRAYVERNATDVNMGLTAVARTFSIKPREAAESFRKYYGESVNDVIHRARVQKAKELLLGTDMSVQEIAEAVGYCSLATMYRAFSNVEGVAPGKMRQNRMEN